ncbi:MAG: c-type cytochrome [Polyangiaceae bacterium]|nr:c-type cytochrome [Polyangiaceae bacterium]
MQLYEQHCARCHDVGAANAPRRGEAQAWEKRLRKGYPTLIKNINSGLVAMPPKGGCAECTDADFDALIHYLVESQP